MTSQVQTRRQAKMLFGDQWVDLSEPHVMGVVNVTPDSFSDGGSLFDEQSLCLNAAMTRARAMVAEGVVSLILVENPPAQAPTRYQFSKSSIG